MASPIHVTLTDGTTHHVRLDDGADPVEQASLLRHGEGPEYSTGWVPVESQTDGVTQWIRQEAIVSLTLTESAL